MTIQLFCEYLCIVWLIMTPISFTEKKNRFEYSGNFSKLPTADERCRSNIHTLLRTIDSTKSVTISLDKFVEALLIDVKTPQKILTIPKRFLETNGNFYWKTGQNFSKKPVDCSKPSAEIKKRLSGEIFCKISNCWRNC